MNISLYGNCQTRALFSYIKKLQPNATIKWLCSDRFLDQQKHEWAWEQHFHGKLVESIYEVQKSINFIQQSDLIVYQNIEPETSPRLNQEIIQNNAKQNANLISIGSYYYDSLLQNPLDGMISRESKLKLSISVVESIKNNPKIDSVDLPSHPNVYYFIDLCDSICSIMNWEKFSENDKKELLEEGYPFC